MRCEMKMSGLNGLGTSLATYGARISQLHQRRTTKRRSLREDARRTSLQMLAPRARDHTHREPQSTSE